MADIKFTARSYYSAAQENLQMAIRLIRVNEYVAAHYYAGLSVECILRAHSEIEAGSWDPSHSIEHWSRKAGFLSALKEDVRPAVNAAIAEINLRWRANQRYMTMKQLDTYLEGAGLDSRIRGDRVKFSAKRLIESANDIVSLGVSKWNPKP